MIEDYGLQELDCYTNSTINQYDIDTQRAAYGVSQSDMWCFDHYFYSMLSNAMKIYINETNGYPANSTSEKWKKTLNRIMVLSNVMKIDFLDTYFIDSLNSFNECYKKFFTWREECKAELFKLLRDNIDDIWW